MNKKLWLMILTSLTLTGCLTTRDLAIRQCRETGAETVTLSSSQSDSHLFSGFLPTVTTNTNNQSSQFNCQKLLKEEKQRQKNGGQSTDQPKKDQPLL